MHYKIDSQNQEIKRPLYIGWLDRNNLGDETLAKAFLEFFPDMQPFPEMSAFQIRLSLLAGLLGWKRLKPSLQNRHIKSILHRFPKSSIFLGGGTLIGSKHSFPILQKAIKDKRNIYTFGCGVMDMQFWAGRSGYPVTSSQYLQEWKNILQKCRNISVRGVQSQRILQSLGISSVVIGDPAIYFASKENIILPKKKILGINFGYARNILWGNDETKVWQILKQVVNHMTKQGWSIKVFSVYIKDTPLCCKWINSLDQPADVELHIEYTNPYQYIQKVQQCDIFVGMKLHATILSFVSQVPSIMLEYRPKCADFMETMKAINRNIRCDRVVPNDLISLIEQTYLDQETIRKEQKQISNYYYNIIQDYFNRLQIEI